MEKIVLNATPCQPIGNDDGQYLGALTKKCSLCGTERPLPEFASWGRTRPGKIKAQCRECLNARKREWHKQNLDHAHESNKGWLESNRDARSEYRRRYNPVYRALNRDRLIEDSRAYYVKNRERLKERVKAWAEANKDLVRALSRTYYLEHTDLVKARVREWGEANPGRVGVYGARKRTSREFVSWSEMGKVEELFENCLEATRSTGVRHAVDHIYPANGKTVSGLNTHDNLRVITFSENSRKGNKLPGHLQDELWETSTKLVYYPKGSHA